MSRNTVQEPGKGRLGRAREKLTLDSRKRFILLFALFNAMFCLLLLLSLQNMQLVVEKRQWAEDKRQMEGSLRTVEALVTEAVKQIVTLGSLLTPEPTSTALPPTATRTPMPPTPVSTATMTQTPVPPSPTATRVPPTRPPTPVPPTPTRKPKPPGPGPSPTRPAEPTSSP